MRVSIMCLVYKHIVFAINYLPSMHNTAVLLFSHFCGSVCMGIVLTMLLSVR